MNALTQLVPSRFLALPLSWDDAVADFSPAGPGLWRTGFGPGGASPVTPGGRRDSESGEISLPEWNSQFPLYVQVAIPMGLNAGFLLDPSVQYFAFFYFDPPAGSQLTYAPDTGYELGDPYREVFTFTGDPVYSGMGVRPRDIGMGDWAAFKDWVSSTPMQLILAFVAGGLVDAAIAAPESTPSAAPTSVPPAVASPAVDAPAFSGGVVDFGTDAAVDLGNSAAPLGVSGAAEIAPAASAAIDAAATLPATGGGILDTLQAGYGAAQQVVGAVGTVRGVINLVNPPKPPARPLPITQPPGAAAPRAPAPVALPTLAMTPAPAGSSRAAGVLAALAPLVLLAFS